MTTLQQTSAAQSNLGPSEAPSRAPSPPGVVIRRATPADAAAIADIGARVFHATFAHTCSQEDMDEYLGENFTEAVILQELKDAAKSVHVACVPASSPSSPIPTPSAPTSDASTSNASAVDASASAPAPASRVAAFLVLNTASSEPCVEHIPAPHRIEVQRVYADPDVQGRGVAKALMGAAMEMVRAQGYTYAWLGVWENNVRATKFYEKFGFARVGEHEFWLGNECQLDYIFGREL